MRISKEALSESTQQLLYYTSPFARAHQNGKTRKKGASICAWFTAPPPPPTTLILHIEVGFKWMWTLLATPNKMAPVVVDLCAGLLVLLPRQIRRFRCGFFFVSCPRLKLEELFLREAPSKATNRGQSMVSSSIFPTLRIVSTKSNLAVEVLVRLLWYTFRQSSIKLLLWALPEWEIWTLKNPYRESHSLESDLYVRF